MRGADPRQQAQPRPVQPIQQPQAQPQQNAAANLPAEQQKGVASCLRSLCFGMILSWTLHLCAPLFAEAAQGWLADWLYRATKVTLHDVAVHQVQISEGKQICEVNKHLKQHAHSIAGLAGKQSLTVLFDMQCC